MMGRPIRIAFKGESTEGIAKGLGDDGCLILVVEGNEEIKVSAGDATIMRWKENAFGD
jgi:biotin-(acetyl-CoA carboxylase) ligase